MLLVVWLRVVVLLLLLQLLLLLGWYDGGDGVGGHGQLVLLVADQVDPPPVEWLGRTEVVGHELLLVVVAAGGKDLPEDFQLGGQREDDLKMRYILTSRLAKCHISVARKKTQ